MEAVITQRERYVALHDVLARKSKPALVKMIEDLQVELTELKMNGETGGKDE